MAELFSLDVDFSGFDITVSFVLLVPPT